MTLENAIAIAAVVVSGVSVLGAVAAAATHVQRIRGDVQALTAAVASNTMALRQLKCMDWSGVHRAVACDTEDTGGPGCL